MPKKQSDKSDEDNSPRKSIRKSSILSTERAASSRRQIKKEASVKELKNLNVDENKSPPTNQSPMQNAPKVMRKVTSLTEKKKKKLSSNGNYSLRFSERRLKLKKNLESSILNQDSLSKKGEESPKKISKQKTKKTSQSLKEVQTGTHKSQNASPRSTSKPLKIRRTGRLSALNRLKLSNDGEKSPGCARKNKLTSPNNSSSSTSTSLQTLEDEKEDFNKQRKKFTSKSESSSPSSPLKRAKIFSESKLNKNLRIRSAKGLKVDSRRKSKVTSPNTDSSSSRSSPIRSLLKESDSERSSSKSQSELSLSPVQCLTSFSGKRIIKNLRIRRSSSLNFSENGGKSPKSSEKSIKLGSPKRSGRQNIISPKNSSKLIKTRKTLRTISRVNKPATSTPISPPQHKKKQKSSVKKSINIPNSRKRERDSPKKSSPVQESERKDAKTILKNTSPKKLVFSPELQNVIKKNEPSKSKNPRIASLKLSYRKSLTPFKKEKSPLKHRKSILETRISPRKTDLKSRDSMELKHNVSLEKNKSKPKIESIKSFGKSSSSKDSDNLEANSTMCSELNTTFVMESPSAITLKNLSHPETPWKILKNSETTLETVPILESSLPSTSSTNYTSFNMKDFVNVTRRKKRKKEPQQLLKNLQPSSSSASSLNINMKEKGNITRHIQTKKEPQQHLKNLQPSSSSASSLNINMKEKGNITRHIQTKKVLPTVTSSTSIGNGNKNYNISENKRTVTFGVPNIAPRRAIHTTKNSSKGKMNNKEACKRAIVTKTATSTKNTVENKKEYVKGIRTNRRFDLLMQMRNKK